MQPPNVQSSSAMAPPEIMYSDRNIAYDPLVTDAAGLDDVVCPISTGRAANLEPVAITWHNLTFDIPNKFAVRRAKKLAKAKGPDMEAAHASGISTGVTVNGVPSVAPFISMSLLPGADPKGPPANLSRVLHGITGSVKPGQMLAILGSSGAGKSTLLSLLAGRIKSSTDCKSGGSVLVNGKKRDFKHFMKQAAYVEQDDCMVVEETVRENLMYSAKLRLPSSMNAKRKAMRVEAVITELGLSVCANTRISNISGGQRKRVSIGSELVTDPSLCILDEPTSGLDAFSALTVMNSLRHLATNGRTVISTIHQPRSSIFALFDLLLVLSEGRTVYSGRAADASAYFANIGFRAPPQFNVADYVIDAASIDYRSKELEFATKKRVLYMAAEHESKHGTVVSEDVVDIENGVDGGTILAPADDDADAAREDFGYETKYQNNLVNEWLILTSRALKKLSRETQQNATRLGQAVVFAILLGMIWLDVGRDDSIDAYRSLSGVLFFIVANRGLDSAFGVIFTFPLERAILTRERSTGAYRTFTYFLASLVLGMLKTFIVNIFFLSIVYWCVGLRASAPAFFFALLCVFVAGQAGESVAQTVSVFSGSPQISAALVPLFVILCFLTAGFFIKPDAMPDWLSWMRYASFMYWGYEAMVKNEFAPIADNAAVASILMDFNDHSKWVNLVVLSAIAVIGKSLFYLSLIYRSPKFDKTL
jgi:ABC-type multidrug transport system ATPase subunit/ABC-type multidrug transport system permease subunit